MATPIEIAIEFPKSQRDLFPAAAQQLYIVTYKQSWAESARGTADQLSHESVAARDAWDAVKRAFVQDFVTHTWRAIGDPVETSAEKRSILSAIKRLFKR